MTAKDTTPPASSLFVSSVRAPESPPEFGAEPVKIEVSCLSAFILPLDSVCVELHEATSNVAVKVQLPDGDEDLRAELVLSDTKKKDSGGKTVAALAKEAALLAERERLLAEHQMLSEKLEEDQMMQDQFDGANLWPQPYSSLWPCMPPGPWQEAENWMQCWPGWAETWPAPAVQEYPMFPPWQESIHSVESPVTEEDSNEKREGLACELDSVDTSVEEISAESTEEGFTVSGCTSEDDCSSPGCSETPKEHVDVAQPLKDGVAAGQALLALVNPSLSDINDLETEEENFSIDDLLLIKMEERESKESGADDKNDDTFGPDVAEGWDFDVMLSANSVVKVASPGRKLPPAPKELPPTPPTPEPFKDSDLVLPPGLPIPGVDVSDATCSASDSIEPPPGLSPCSRKDSNSGSDADVSDIEPERFSSSELECWNSRVTDASDKKQQLACNVLHGDDRVSPPSVDEVAQKSSDEELQVTPQVILQGAAPATIVSEATLPQLAVDSSLPPLRNKHGSETSSVECRASCKKTKIRNKAAAEPRRPQQESKTVTEPRRPQQENKTAMEPRRPQQENKTAMEPRRPQQENKTATEPRRPRKKNQATASEKLEIPASFEDASTTNDIVDAVEAPNGHSWGRLLVLGLVMFLIAIVAKSQGRLFTSDGLQNSMTPIMRGESHAWGAQLPQDSPAHSRNQQISSIMKNMDIEIARAKAVASDIKSKMNNAKTMRKAKKQQEQMMNRQRDGSFWTTWQVVGGPHAQMQYSR